MNINTFWVNPLIRTFQHFIESQFGATKTDQKITCIAAITDGIILNRNIFHRLFDTH